MNDTRSEAAAPATQSGGGSPTTRFRVFRYKHGDRAPHEDAFQVEVGPRTTVLDGLVAIRTRQDPSLTLRHSCFHGSCGTCGMRVNGQEVLACVTNVRELGGSEVRVEPLLNAPLVSDLVVDMAELNERLVAFDRPLMRASDALPQSQPPDGIEAYMRFEDCIECGLCVSACPIAASDARYLGPAALASAWRIVEEPRGHDPARALHLADGEHGAWRCHHAFECIEVCPTNVDPAGDIFKLRRRSVGNRLRSLVGAGRGS
jgi:succinate dehydrogenase / fumarate reductase iron-sulfur subunit